MISHEIILIGFRSTGPHLILSQEQGAEIFVEEVVIDENGTEHVVSDIRKYIFSTQLSFNPSMFMSSEKI